MITRWAVIGILAASSIMPATQAFGNEKKHKVLRDSAEALRTVDSDLSARLKRFVDDKAQRKDKKASVSAADIQLIRDSAAALRATRPELAKELESMADKKARKAEGAGAERGDMTPPADRTTTPPAERTAPVDEAAPPADETTTPPADERATPPTRPGY